MIFNVEHKKRAGFKKTQMQNRKQPPAPSPHLSLTLNPLTRDDTCKAPQYLSQCEYSGVSKPTTIIHAPLCHLAMELMCCMTSARRVSGPSELHGRILPCHNLNRNIAHRTNKITPYQQQTLDQRCASPLVSSLYFSVPLHSRPLPSPWARMICL